MVYTQALVFGNGMTVVSEEDRLVEFMKKFVHQFTSSSRKDGQSLEANCEYTEAIKSSSVEWLDPGSSMEDCVEEALQLELAKQIELCLSDAKTSRLHCQELLLPRRLTTRVARDVMLSSADEPCGLRGALIHVLLETKGVLQPLGSITPDRCVTPTFELSIVFKADPAGWAALKNFFVADKALTLHAGYRLVKRKLYSSASPIVRDFD
ncbi:DNA damage-inducible transcript 4-like protein [Megalops cyprinoides]|uniref:DNA damage-inducible transcript 4-like protein n=1 Tax=Megalops cyprinoides TaxID=118141 RepID=UPI0018647810|nr:DNA damage-inducible transcript 4-like protein [Megalops cyprinoides]